MDYFSLSKLLDESEEKFTITQAAYEKLEKSVKNVGDIFLENIDGARAYLQGSFAYGTIIRPYMKDKDGDYDIDLVIELPATYSSKDAEYVKNLVGMYLKRNDYRERLEEGKRCWTLDYSDTKNPDVAFHLDILPSVSADIQNGNEIQNTEIKITNRTDDGYSWSSSNPKGYRIWLSDIDRKHCNEENIKPSSTVETDLNRVADPVNTTPLRSAIKILKRSRDVFFSDRDDSEYSPVSIIITTIVAQIVDSDEIKYNEVAPIFDKIMSNLHNAGPKNNGSWILLNPIDSKENFADRWNTDERYVSAYYAWCNYMVEQWNMLKIADEMTAKRTIEKMVGLKDNSLQNISVYVPKSISTSISTPKSYVGE